MTPKFLIDLFILLDSFLILINNPHFLYGNLQLSPWLATLTKELFYQDLANCESPYRS